MSDYDNWKTDEDWGQPKKHPPEKEWVSECCYALPFGELSPDNKTGYCADCKEGAVFTEEEYE